eukprot:c20596_g1_i1 orf=125-946(+)
MFLRFSAFLSPPRMWKALPLRTPVDAKEKFLKGNRNDSSWWRCKRRCYGCSNNSRCSVINPGYYTSRPSPSAKHLSSSSAVFIASNDSVSTACTVSETCDPVATEPEDGLSRFVFDGFKLTAVAHSVWHRIVKVGDTVIDATCGNGHDTLILARLVSRDSQQGHVYGFDLQQSALDITSLLLDKELTPFQREHVKLHQMCHSRLDEVVKDFDSVRVVAFNLGYLPGGNKSIITQATTTLRALESAKRIIKPGGLISIIAYVGHEGGRYYIESL